MGQALDYARLATARAERHAADADEEAQWERDRPEGTSRTAWRRAKQKEREAARAAQR
ncbi:hypothetical protein ACFVYD_28405 [Streptomyces sp. NPDC058301]|uniref:hypothetical protein n=1 Tax=Streptomyces sp. NPDC058301 TaxID=3346436 RepID=UPI0036E0117F